MYKILGFWDKNFCFDQCHNKEFLSFFFSESYFIKAIENVFSCVCIAWYKHSRGWENSRQLCEPSTSSRVCRTISTSPNPSRVYIRLCKHEKRFLLPETHGFLLLLKCCIVDFAFCRVRLNGRFHSKAHTPRTARKYQSSWSTLHVNLLWLFLSLCYY